MWAFGFATLIPEPLRPGVRDFRREDVAQEVEFGLMVSSEDPRGGVLADAAGHQRQDGLPPVGHHQARVREQALRLRPALLVRPLQIELRDLVLLVRRDDRHHEPFGLRIFAGRSRTTSRQDILQFRHRNVAVSFSRRALTAISVAWSARDGVTRRRPPSRPARPIGVMRVTTISIAPDWTRRRTSTVRGMSIRSQKTLSRTSSNSGVFSKVFRRRGIETLSQSTSRRKAPNFFATYTNAHRRNAEFFRITRNSGSSASGSSGRRISTTCCGFTDRGTSRTIRYGSVCTPTLCPKRALMSDEMSWARVSFTLEPKQAFTIRTSRADSIVIRVSVARGASPTDPR